MGNGSTRYIIQYRCYTRGDKKDKINISMIFINIFLHYKDQKFYFIEFTNQQTSTKHMRITKQCMVCVICIERKKLLTQLFFAEIGIVGTRASDAGLLCSLRP